MIRVTKSGRAGSGLLPVMLAAASLAALAVAAPARAVDLDAPIRANPGSASAVSPRAAGERPIQLADADAGVGLGAGVADGPAAAPVATAPDFGKGFFQRFLNYQAWEIGKMGPPDDPTAPPSRRPEFPPAPQTTPPMPFTEWPYGATSAMGATRPNSVDSPLMVALAPTGFGKLLNDAHIQIYGWVNAGGNLSTSKVAGGNAPAAYDYIPNTVQLDQAVVYIERLPDTVQKDHIDWGFRLSGLYGTDYRYTTAYGLWSYQLLKYNKKTGYDAPMMYGEIYIPQIAQGVNIRIGRFISIPDIEAQLAPNNYMYSHSLGYTFDNYTNTGIEATIAVTKNFFVQVGVNAGTESLPWHVGLNIKNPYPNPLYPGATFKKDPGAQPSFTGCLRYQTNSANDNVYLCADAINNGEWGYNNLQWYGMTYYHRFSDKWHLSFETYNLHQDKVPNLNSAVVQNIIANGGTPFSGPAFKYNAPGGAICKNDTVLSCTASATAALFYLNYHFLPLDNLSIRGEYYDDAQGQRTGVKTRYAEVGLGVQHWFSPQIELRPEIVYYRSFDANAFNGNGNLGIAPNRDYEVVLSGDIIAHF